MVHVPQQLFPQMQVADGRRYGDQFAVGAAGHGFAMHITDMSPQRAGGAGGGLVLPVPVANVEGHLDRQVVLFDGGEETLKRLDAPSVQGLVVLYQQMHRALLESLGQRLQVRVVSEVAERDFQPFRTERLGLLQRGNQFGIRLRLPGQPQFCG